MSAESRRRRRMRRATPANYRLYVGHKCEAFGLNSVPCYWLGGVCNMADVLHYDSSAKFCKECADGIVESIYNEAPHRAELNEVRVEGGYSIDHDFAPHCEACGVWLSGDLTQSGIDYEMDALRDYAKPSPHNESNWSALAAVVNARSAPTNSIYGHHLEYPDFWRDVAKLVKRARRMERHHA